MNAVHGPTHGLRIGKTHIVIALAHISRKCFVCPSRAASHQVAHTLRVPHLGLCSVEEDDKYITKSRIDSKSRLFYHKYITKSRIDSKSRLFYHKYMKKNIKIKEQLVFGLFGQVESVRP